MPLCLRIKVFLCVPPHRVPLCLRIKVFICGPLPRWVCRQVRYPDGLAQMTCGSRSFLGKLQRP